MPIRRGQPGRDPRAAGPSVDPSDAGAPTEPAVPAVTPVSDGILARRPALALGLLAALAATVAGAAYWAGVLAAGGQRVENLALLGAQIRSEAERAASLARLEPISIASFALALLAIVFTGYMRNRTSLGLVVAMAAGVAVVLAEILKVVLMRPEFEPGARWILRNSFPSGTVTVAMAVALGAIVVAPDRLRWAVLLAGSVLVAVVGHSVQVTGWHRLSDVAGGAGLAVAVMSAGVAVLAANGWAERSTTGRIHPGIYRVLVLAAAAVIAVGVLAALFLAAFPILNRLDGGDRALLQVAFPLIGAGVSVLLLATFARVIAPWTFRAGAGAPGTPGLAARAPDERSPDARAPGERAPEERATPGRG